MEHAIKQQDSVNASKMSQVGSVMDVQILSGVFVYLLLGTVEVSDSICWNWKIISFCSCR